MNEYTKALYNDAVQHTKAQDNGKLSQIELNNICASVFAASIVKECLAICEDKGDKGLDGHYCADAIVLKFKRGTK